MKKKGLILLLWVMGYLGLNNGYLALYDDSNTQPLMVLPYCAQMYPAQDQQALTQGIPFENQQELARILEDFLS